MIQKRTTKRGTRYEVRLRGPDGRETSRSFRTSSEAKAYERRVLSERDRGVWIDPRRGVIAFAEVAEAWLGSNPAKRPAVRVRDEAMLRRHVLPHIGERHVGSITPADIQALVKRWGTSVGPGTVRKQYSIVRAVFAWAMDADYIARTPCRKTAVRLPRAPAPVAHHVITPDELAALADAIGPRFAPMVYVGAILGLRWGEVAALRVRSIDFLRRTVTVTEAVARDGHGGHILAEPKSATSRRAQSAPQALVDLLARHVTACGLTGQPDAFLFSQGDGEPVDYPNFYSRRWRPAVAKVGLPGPVGSSGRKRFYGFHDLRRANATALARRGVDPRTAQGRLGHSDIRLTFQVYAELSTAADKAAGDALGAHFLDGARNGARDKRGMDSPFPSAVGDGSAPTSTYPEPGVGIEPTTSALQERCSTN